MDDLIELDVGSAWASHRFSAPVAL